MLWRSAALNTPEYWPCNAGTVPLPTCIMGAQVGADLRSAMGAKERAIIDVTHLGSLSITIAPLATSKNFTTLQIAGELVAVTRK